MGAAAPSSVADGGVGPRGAACAESATKATRPAKVGTTTRISTLHSGIFRVGRIDTTSTGAQVGRPPSPPPAGPAWYGLVLARLAVRTPHLPPPLPRSDPQVGFPPGQVAEPSTPARDPLTHRPAPPPNHL